MTIKFEAKLNGFDILLKDLELLSKREATKATKKATREASKILLNEMRRNVPVRTGNLRRSLGIVNVKRTTPGAWLKVGARKGKRLKNDGWYAHLVEFPTRAHKIKGRNHPGTKAQPFIRPAVDSKGNEVIKELGKELGRQIEAAL